MYLLAHERDVETLIAAGRWWEANMTGLAVAELIRALPDPENYWVLGITGRADGLCRVMVASEFLLASPQQALLANPEQVFSAPPDLRPW